MSLKVKKMGFTRKIWICYKVVFAIIVCVWVSGSKGDGEGDFKLFRAKQDIFTNECEDEDRKCEISGCKVYKADCYANYTCQFCRCQEPFNTLTYNMNDKSIEWCKSDEEIQDETGT